MDGVGDGAIVLAPEAPDGARAHGAIVLVPEAPAGARARARENRGANAIKARAARICKWARKRVSSSNRHLEQCWSLAEKQGHVTGNFQLKVKRDRKGVPGGTEGAGRQTIRG